MSHGQAIKFARTPPFSTPSSSMVRHTGWLLCLNRNRTSLGVSFSFSTPHNMGYGSRLGYGHQSRITNILSLLPLSLFRGSGTSTKQAIQGCVQDELVKCPPSPICDPCLPPHDSRMGELDQPQIIMEDTHQGFC